MESFFDIEKISVMGILEPLLNIFELLSLRRSLKEFLVQQKPDIFIGIDAPEFNLPISKFLKQRIGIKTVQYVSPSIWAWREGRIKTIEKSVDKILTLFPFEKEAYKNSSIDNLDIKSSNLIKKKQISVVLFFSLRSAKMWIELINKSNLLKFLLSVNCVVINEEVSKYLKELKFKNVIVARRKRRASVLSLGMKVFNNLEIL